MIVKTSQDNESWKFVTRVIVLRLLHVRQSFILVWCTCDLIVASIYCVKC